MFGHALNDSEWTILIVTLNTLVKLTKHQSGFLLEAGTRVLVPIYFKQSTRLLEFAVVHVAFGFTLRLFIFVIQYNWVNDE